MAVRIIMDLFLLIGAYFALAGTIGTLLMPDTFSRMQASTCVSTLGFLGITIGGLLLTTPAQATVIRLSRSKPGSVPRQESITAGIGARKVVAPMARKLFAIICLHGNLWKEFA